MLAVIVILVAISLLLATTALWLGRASDDRAHRVLSRGEDRPLVFGPLTGTLAETIPMGRKGKELCTRFMHRFYAHESSKAPEAKRFFGLSTA